MQAGVASCSHSFLREQREFAGCCMKLTITGINHCRQRVEALSVLEPSPFLNSPQSMIANQLDKLPSSASPDFSCVLTRLFKWPLV